MGLLRAICSANAYLIFVAGFPTSVFLFWLIHKHTPAEMLAYRRILLQICFVDMAMIVSQSVVQPLIFIDGNGAPATVLASPLVSWVPCPWNFVVYNIWNFVIVLCNLQFGLLFIYRWFMVTRSYNIPFLPYILLLLTPSTMQVIASFINADFDASFAKPNIIAAWISEQLDVGNSTHALRSKVSTFSKLYQYGEIVHSTLTFLVVVIFAAKTSRFVRRNLTSPNAKRNRDIINQLNRVLVIQVFVVVFFAYIPRIVFLFLFNILNLQLSLNELMWVLNLSFVIVFWLPLVNTVVTILSVKPYRRFVFHAFRQHSLRQSSAIANNAAPLSIIVAGGNRMNGTRADQERRQLKT